MKAAAAHAADLPGHSPPAGARQPWAVALDSALGHLVEIPAALLVVAEIIILFSGIVARYVLHTPLVWSDELASILFLWLAMLGSVIAFRRGETCAWPRWSTAPRPRRGPCWTWWRWPRRWPFC